MRFEVFFGLAILWMIISPKTFFMFGQRIIEGLMPIVQQGLVLALMIAGIIVIVGRFK